MHAPPQCKQVPTTTKPKAGAREISGTRSNQLLIQTRLTVNQPGDEYEQEADRVADSVMRMPESPFATGLADVAPQLLQRACAECEDELLQRRATDENAGPTAGEERTRQRRSAAGATAQRQAIEDEEEVVQTKAASPSQAPRPVTGKHASFILQVKRGAAHTLPSPVRQFMEPRFGRDFGRVRLHTDTRASASARAVGARAYTLGRHIVFGQGQFQPSTPSGRRLLAHELAHVVQQTGGAPFRPVQEGGADRVHARARGESGSARPGSSIRPATGSLLQRDLAIRPPRPDAEGRVLPEAQMRAAIAYNERFLNSIPDSAEVIGLLRDVLGTSPTPPAIDEDFVNAVLDWQASYGLSQDGKLGPGTARPLFREIGAEGAGECRVEDGPTYRPSGTIPTTALGGGRASAFFRLAAEFESDPANGVLPSCCEIRQSIWWDDARAAAFGAGGRDPVPHGGFPATHPANTWIEDRDAANTRYGHRSGPLSAPTNGDQYLDSDRKRNQAFGHIYTGSDRPETGFLAGQYRFMLWVVDVCNGSRRVGNRDFVRIRW